MKFGFCLEKIKESGLKMRIKTWDKRMYIHIKEHVFGGPCFCKVFESDSGKDSKIEYDWRPNASDMYSENWETL